MHTKIVALMCGLVLVISASCLAQDQQWHFTDSLVPVLKTEGGREEVGCGLVFKVEDGNAYVWIDWQQSYYKRVDRELNRDSRNPSHQILVRGDSLEAHWIDAREVLDAQQTGRPEIWVADADELPPAIKMGSFAELTEGDPLTNVVWHFSPTEGGWEVRKRDMQLTATQISLARHSTQLVRTSFSSDNPFAGFAFGEDGSLYGEFRLQRATEKNSKPRSGSIYTSGIHHNEQLDLFIRTRGVRGVGSKETGKSMEFFVGLSSAPLDAIQSVKARYWIRPEKYRKPFNKSLSIPPDAEEVELKRMPEGDWPEIQRLSEIVVADCSQYPCKEFWGGSFVPPEPLASGRRHVFHYQFVVHYRGKKVATPVYIGTSPEALAGTEKLLGKLAFDAEQSTLPMLLSTNGSRVRQTELDSSLNTGLLKKREVETTIQEMESICGFQRRQFEFVDRGWSLLPMAVNSDESRAAIVNFKGELFVCETKDWKVVSPIRVFEFNLLATGWWKDHLYVMPYGRSRVLKIDPDTMQIVAEIGLPKAYRGLSTQNYDTRLLFHENSNYGVVCNSNHFISLNLETNQAEYWTPPQGTSIKTVDRRKLMPCYYRFTPEGDRLFFSCQSRCDLIKVGAEIVHEVSTPVSGRPSCLMVDDKNQAIIYGPVWKQMPDRSQVVQFWKMPFEDFGNPQLLFEWPSQKLTRYEQWVLSPDSDYFIRLSGRASEQALTAVDLNGEELGILDSVEMQKRRRDSSKVLILQMLPKTRRLLGIGQRTIEYAVPGKSEIRK